MALKLARGRLERWRGTRRGRARIPEELWSLAVEAVSTHGLNKTARALGLDYYSLKKRVESAADDPRGPAKRRGRKAPRVARPVEVAPRFVELASGVAELVPARSSGAPACVLEFERAGGAKLRVQLPSVAAADLVALGRSFWSVDA
ncbi:MAG: hypothetical protein AB1716_23370 [Planctomycetota bacterium]